MNKYVPSGFKIEDWVKDGNIVLRFQDNLTLFEKESEGVFIGHYFFNSAKGKEAIRLSNNCLDYMFNIKKAKLIKGLTPIDNKPARWMSRKIGFKSCGFADTKNGVCEIFYKTKED